MLCLSHGRDEVKRHGYIFVLYPYKNILYLLCFYNVMAFARVFQRAVYYVIVTSKAKELF